MSESLRLTGYAALAAVILFNSIGNLLLKVGANSPPSRLTLEMASWQTLAGIVCFACSVLSYAWALKHFPLHVAQIIVSIQYIVTIALAASLLGEPISAAKWFGIALIAVGLFFCSR